MNLQGKTVLVLGMGETGLSMVKWLTRQGAIVRVADSRVAPPNLDAIQRAIPISQIFTGKFVAEIFSRIDLIAVSPGIPLAEPLMQDAVKRGVSVVGDIELRRLDGSEDQKQKFLESLVQTGKQR
jgi:UDP-N-acetylmuramoylalanine--D-glutamate ligase